MKLNNSSYVHVQIRKLCLQLELLSGMKLLTDLNEEFDEIRFINAYGYIIIDYERNTCFAFAHKITKEEMATIEDILTYIHFLSIGLNYAEKRRKRK